MSSTPSRRKFLSTASAGAAMAFTAASYGRIAGANERIALGLIGCGGRGYDAHMGGVHPHDKGQNVEFTAVSDPWRFARAGGGAVPAVVRPARHGSSLPTATFWP